MTLTTRLSVFFLATLGLVLAGFSAAVYLLARDYLHRQTEERLRGAVATLVAAAEVGPEGVEWEPAERTLAFGAGPSGEGLMWLVRNDTGQVLDRSVAPPPEFLAAVDRLASPGETTRERAEWGGEPWLVSTCVLQKKPGTAQPTNADPEKRYSELTIAAAIPLGPVAGTLRQLAAALVGVTSVIWLLSLVLGRTVSRRALRPLTAMAHAARTRDAAEFERRLPVPATGDELEDLSRAFNGLLDRLHEAFERQRRFTGDASHQLRTPLTAVLGQIEVALRRERAAAEYRQTLGTVHRQAQHLRQIVEALLFLARADAEARLPGMGHVELGAWLTQHLGSWSDHPRAADLRLELPAYETFQVCVHPVLLGELVNVLIENACKYSAPGSPVILRLVRVGEVIQMQVEDRGCGIAAEDRARVFEPFFRSAEARRRGIAGVGLGLAIAERLAGAFGGSLSVSSEPGQGSRFTLSLPAVPPKDVPKMRSGENLPAVPSVGCAQTGEAG